MCQLTLIDLKERRKNSLFAYLALTINSAKLHKDGFGFLANKKDIFKSDKCASNISNLAEIIATMNDTDDIILGHVRQISSGKVAKVEDSHPFREKDFVLAHNGTLKWKDKKNESKYSGIIDSEIFAKELQEEYNINGNFVECIQKTYAKFTGKFAFLIYNTREDCFYVVRGKTAKLHIATILKLEEEENLVPTGSIINTEIDSLREAVYSYTDILQLMEEGTYDFTIEEIKEETIYKYHDNSLEKVGEIKENYEIIVRETEWENSAFLRNRSIYYGENKNTPVITRLSKFMDENMLSFQDLDNIFYCAFNKCLLDCNEADIDMDLLERFASINTSAKKKYWNRMAYKFYSPEMYQKYDLAYPYFLNDKRKLAIAFNKIRREEKELYRGK